MKLTPGPSYNKPPVLKSVTPALPDPPSSPEAARAFRHLCAAQHAADAYRDPETLKTRFGHPSFEFGEEDDFAFFALLDGSRSATIAFRGTVIEHRSNRRADMNCLLAGAPGRHKGFMGAWALLEPRVLRWLQAHQPSSITLTGHSLGGALVLLAAYELAGDWPIEEVTVFGCPRVGTPRFASDYEARKSGPDRQKTLGEITTRYVHSTDVISRIPPPFFWYKHVGEPFYLNEDGIRIYYPQPYLMRVAETASGVGAFQAPGYTLGLSRSAQAHRPDFSLLSTLARAVGPTLGYGFIPLWATCALGASLTARFVWRDIDYFHDSKRYVDILAHRQSVIERGPTWWQPTI